MAKPLNVIIKEDLPYLKSCLKKQPVHMKNRIQEEISSHDLAGLEP
jgi:hypothetical protein